MRSYQKNQRYYSCYKLIFAIICIIGLLNSCVTSRKTTYLQEYEESKYPTEIVPPETYQIQPNDNLFIRVTTPDPRWSAMFNTVPVSNTSMALTEQSVEILSYSVQLDGTVDIPYLGSILVAGKTVAEAKEALDVALADYVTDADITVKLVNNYLSILGDVNVPGRYPIYKEQLNIFQALAMAGDIANYGNRYKVSLIRQTMDGTIVKEIDLTDKNIIDSEYYYVLPNDMIYVQPMKGKFFAMSQFPFALIFSSITTFILVLSYIQ